MAPSRLLLLPLLAAACASAQASRGPAADPGASALRAAGDLVEYRFTGAYTPDPVTVVQEVVAVDGDRQRIRFTSTRGDQRRSWIQTVRPGAGEGGADALEEVVAVSGDDRRPLDPRDPRVLGWLYEWTIARVKGLPEDVDTGEVRAEFAGRAWTCTAQTGVLRSRDGGKARFRFLECPDFPWTVGPGRIDAPDGRVIWEREVVRVGRR